MKEYKINMIHDCGSYKISYSKEGKQAKVTIGSEKAITIMAARKICNEVEDILKSEMDWFLLKKLYELNRDGSMCGYKGSILTYQNLSIELAVRIREPERINDLISDNQLFRIDAKQKPLEILNIGCTGSGKTRFIIGSFLSKEGLKNFVPALTSLKETTACSIIYHLNSGTVSIKDGCDFRVDVDLKNKAEIENSIKGLIIESAEEYIVTIKENSKQIKEIEELCSKCRKAAAKRLELNYDKTFGLGKRELNKELSDTIESLTKTALVRYYGSSKSIDKLADDDPYFIIKQLICDFENEQVEISSDEIHRILSNYQNEAVFLEMADIIFAQLQKALDLYNDEYSSGFNIGGVLSYSGNTQCPDTLIQLSHVFGNKSRQKTGDFYTIEPIIKKAEFYFNAKELPADKEVILSDSVGINQGQKDAARMNEVVFNRVQEAVQTRKPDIILYHTRLNSKDDYMLDVVKKLNAQGYGEKTFIVSGRLDDALLTYLTDNNLEMEEMNPEIFEEFLEEINQIYIESDSVTLNSIVGNRYYLCDKTNKLADKFVYAAEYGCPAIFEKIIASCPADEEKNTLYDDIDFMEIIQENNVPGSVYQQYLNKIPAMIPMAYQQMRWNTLQKAIEELYWDRYGFDVLYPAFAIKEAISDELNKENIKNEFADKFGHDAEEMKRRYLLEVTDAAQIVLVTEHRTFMRRLLLMRYHPELRTDLSTSMTNDRKYNLQKLYNSCLEQEGMKGAYTLKIIIHIAWIRTLKHFQLKAVFSL